MNNLQTLKAAAFEMYMEEPKIASLNPINNDATIEITPAGKDESNNDIPAVTKSIAKYLGERLGRKDLATGYGIVGDGTAWFVYYTLTDSDTANVKAKLQNQAQAVGLWVASAVTDTSGFTDYYSSTSTGTYIALKVR